MKVIVTGSDGFIGKNLIERLSRIDDMEVIKFNSSSRISDLSNCIGCVDYIFHLAGVNRPINSESFSKVNEGLTAELIDFLVKNEINIPIIFSSSSQANVSNDYGRSKRKAEDHLINYSALSATPVFIYRLPGVFGKWSKPNYNSVISTWCHNVINDNDILIDDPNKVLELVYIDDVVDSFLSKLTAKNSDFDCKLTTVYRKRLGEILELITRFKESRDTLVIPTVGTGFERALYATYLSFIPLDKFKYKLKGYSDNRGSFFEFLKTIDSGQVSISVTKPGNVVRGNHYHHTKNEKFLVVGGSAIINLRHLVNNQKISYKVSADVMEVVEMIPGYTHNIINTSNESLVLLIWANEVFDRLNPDTYIEDV